MKRNFNLMLILFAFRLTDVGMFLTDLTKHLFVHLCRPVFREVSPNSSDRADLTMVVKSHHGTTRQIPIRLENRWMTRKFKTVPTAHKAMFELTDEALQAGYLPVMFVLNGDEYEVECTAPDGEWAGRCITITEPFHF
jgi:hypothetical protein